MKVLPGCWRLGPAYVTFKPATALCCIGAQVRESRVSLPNIDGGASLLNAGWVTTFNRHAVVSENRCTTIPSETDPDAAALFGCAVTTGFGVVENNAKLKMGEAVVVFGAGGIGLNIVQAAALVSAGPIIAVDRFDSRLKLAQQMGATHCINSNSNDPAQAIQKALSGQMLDVFIDNTGLPAIIELGYELTHRQGRVVLVGVPRRGNTVNLYSLPLHFGKQLTGSHGVKPCRNTTSPGICDCNNEANFSWSNW